MSTPTPVARPVRTSAAVAVATMLLTALALAGAFAVLAVDHALRTHRAVGDDVVVSGLAASIALLCLAWLRLAGSRTA